MTRRRTTDRLSHKLASYFAAPLATALVVGLIGWGTLANRVAQNEKAIERNAAASRQLGEDIGSIREDVAYVRGRIERFLRQNGYGE